MAAIETSWRQAGWRQMAGGSGWLAPTNVNVNVNDLVAWIETPPS